MIKKRATRLAEEVYRDKEDAPKFAASSGWLSRFKNRMKAANLPASEDASRTVVINPMENNDAQPTSGQPSSFQAQLMEVDSPANVVTTPQVRLVIIAHGMQK